MIFDIPCVITLILAAMLCLIILDRVWLKPKRMAGSSRHWIIENSYSLFPLMVIVWVLRSFVGQPFVVPSGSLEPTVQPVEFLMVNQLIYGIRLPIIHKKIMNISEPKKGDIVVFRWPPNPHYDYVKRVIGVPGDHIQFHNNVLTINGVPAKQQFIQNAFTIDPEHEPVAERQESLNGVKHDIYVSTAREVDGDFDIQVPAGHYFMMGDNRTFSGDSRMWGFVPEENIIGKAFLVWFSLDTKHWRLRWHRFGTRI